MQVKTALETALAAFAGKPTGVLVRTAVEMSDILSSNPFPDCAIQQDGGYLPG